MNVRLHAKKMITESNQDVRYVSEEEAEAFISSRDSDGISGEDIIDEDDGFVYLEMGQSFGEAKFKHTNAFDDGDDDVVSGDDWREHDRKIKEEAREAFTAAVQEFASDYANWGEENSIDDENFEQEANGVAADAALNFFPMHSNWRLWCADLDMTKEDMREYITDMVYEAIRGM